MDAIFRRQTLPLVALYLSLFPQMDHISLRIEACTDRIKMLLYRRLPLHPKIFCLCFMACDFLLILN